MFLNTIKGQANSIPELSVIEGLKPSHNNAPGTFCVRCVNLKHNMKSHMQVHANSISEFSVLEGLKTESTE